MNNALFASEKHDWETPAQFFAELNREFNFTLDPCCYPQTAKAKTYYTKSENGLIQNWAGHTVFCNPPYGSEIGEWAKKCYQESRKPGTTVVLLIPSRTDTAYFHDWIYRKAELRFVRGRLKFVGAKSSAPFPSMLAVYRVHCHPQPD